MIDLLRTQWFRIRRADGRVEWITPSQIAEPDIVGFAAHRADFNGALAQMMTGLLQTCAPVNSEGQWKKYFATPPQEADLAAWFEPWAEAFMLDGDGARFMQDLNMADGAECGIDALLIDAAGGSAIDKNTDLFVKRGTVNAMCPHCVATALFTLQTNAPAGGAGHRTSLRGGGPLTTLVVASPPKSLWHDLWLNVLPQREFLSRSGDEDKSEPWFTFPWLAQTTAIQAAGAETQPLQVHPYHVFWAMPRRIRLDFDHTTEGQCSICKRESAQLVQRYITKPQGLNYKGPWRHPYSPYYESKEGWLPVHPQPGGFSYRHWQSWVLGSQGNKKAVQAAATVTHAITTRRQAETGMRLWVFGYDMDNMKPRCWYETTWPVFSLPELSPNERKVFDDVVRQTIEAAEQAVFYLRQAVKQAWFGDSDQRGDLSFVDKMFWDSTDRAFHLQLKAIVEQLSAPGGLGRGDSAYVMQLADQWLQALRQKAVRLFDVDIVGAGPIAQQNPRRTALAYQNLRNGLDGKAIKTILGLPVPVVEKAAKRQSAKSLQAASA